MRFSLSNEATGENDEQSCSVALSDLKQVAAQSGIALRAKDEGEEKDANAEAEHCALQILGDDDHLVVEVDGCKSAGGAMLCSARGSWTELVLDRKTQTCKAMQ